MARVLSRLRTDESGVTLVELLIVMVVTSLVGVLAGAILVTSGKLVGGIDDETKGLADLRTVEERMSRDLRAARGIDAGSDQSRLSIWIDSNSDYKRSAAEIITWRLVAGADPGQFDVIRGDDSGTVSVVGTTLVSQLAFSYFRDDSAVAVDPLNPAVVATANVVAVTMTYDADPGQFAKQRTTGFDVRLRNAA